MSNTPSEWQDKIIAAYKALNTGLDDPVIEDAKKLILSNGVRDRELQTKDLSRIAKHFLDMALGNKKE